MNVEINNVAVLVAALSSMVVGSFWYSKSGFGKTWMKLSNVTEKQMKEGGFLPMVWALVRSLLTAYILAHVIFISNNFFGGSYFANSLTTGFYMWLGFGGVMMVMRDAFEGRPKNLTLLNVANEFVTIMVMALVIGLIGL
ncbi:MAG: DUF1761 domain-containing protein [Candidatus Nomurabacteria bacterium]|nr:MAG: DUF1761 domain-containing protein [Candidatus Nomurabacteria bacterium]HRV75907.1 DUF1761 domain-containing protein [Candidatus Saccharimonadales bacterium]